MKKAFLFLGLICLTANLYAEEKKDAKKEMNSQEHMQMHEKMAKAHKDAADCLKSGKPEEECKTAFHSMCNESGRPEMCGHMMGNHKDHKQHKQW